MSGFVFSWLVLVFSSDVSALELFEQWDVASEHNYHRSNVQPTAADMLFMTWYETAETNAQLRASECKRTKSEPMKDTRYGNCSQNILFSPELLSWNEVVDTWAGGVFYFKYGSAQNNLSQIRSYAQIIWAQSHKLGCGFEKCEDENGVFHKYVCNYCPGLAIGRINTPYQQGETCSACKGICLINGLCAPIFHTNNSKTNEGSLSSPVPLNFTTNATMSTVVTLTTKFPVAETLKQNSNLIFTNSSAYSIFKQNVLNNTTLTQNVNLTSVSVASANVSEKANYLIDHLRDNGSNGTNLTVSAITTQSTPQQNTTNSAGPSQNALIIIILSVSRFLVI